MRCAKYLLFLLALLTPLPATAQSAVELLQRGVSQLKRGDRPGARSSFHKALNKKPTVALTPGQKSREASALFDDVRGKTKGTLIVMVKRSWGEVYLDGHLVGRTPYSGAVTVGRHRVEVRRGERRHGKSLVIHHKVNTELYLRNWPETPETRMAAARKKVSGAAPISRLHLLHMLVAILQYWLPL